MRDGIGALLGIYDVLRGNRNLSLLYAGQVVSAFGDRLYIIVAMVLAYNITHSATIVALLNLMRLVPSAIFLPFAGILADRFNRRALMIVADLGRALCMLGLLAVSSRSTLWIAFPLISATTAFLSLFRPALNAVLPAVVGDDQQLVKANTLMSQVEALAWVFAPAVAGVLILTGRLWLAFALNAASYVISASTLLLLDLPPRTADSRPRDEQGWLAETLAGFRFLFHENEGVLGAVTVPFLGFQLFEGAFWALLVVLTTQAWHFGSQGTGFVNTAYGAGGLIAGFLIGLVSRKVRPDAGFVGAIAMRSVIVVCFGLSPAGIWPFLVLGFLGIADVMTLIFGFTIIQTATPRDFLGRSFGAFESANLSAKVVGTLCAGPLIDALGVRATTVVLGLLALALLLVCLPRIRRLEATLGVRLFLRRVPALSMLSRATLDDVARHLHLECFPGQAAVIRQGEPGDKLYIVKSGELDVLVHDGDGRDTIVDRRLPMEYFGEIALLRDVPRTATVQSRGPVELYSLSRAEFESLLRRSAELYHTMQETGDARYSQAQLGLTLLR